MSSKARFRLPALVAVLVLVVAACGTNDESTAADAAAGSGSDTGEQAEESESTFEESTVEEEPEPAADGQEAPSGAAAGESGDTEIAEIDDPVADAAVEAFTLVYDSTADWADKAPHLENAADLEAANAAYRAAGDGMGDIALEPTAAVLDGDTATITYNVLFGGTPAYTDLTRAITLVDGVWVVSEADYCGFLATARAPCS